MTLANQPSTVVVVHFWTILVNSALTQVKQEQSACSHHWQQSNRRVAVSAAAAAALAATDVQRCEMQTTCNADRV